MSNKIEIKMEYSLRCSTNILFKRLSTALGLTEWFADDVKVKGNRFTFIWNGYGQDAELTHITDGVSVEFRWLEDNDPNNFFRFELETSELFDDITLHVTDHIEPDEADSQYELWESQISKLRSLLGA